jgi:hypothetical protein
VERVPGSLDGPDGFTANPTGCGRVARQLLE